MTGSASRWQVMAQVSARKPLGSTPAGNDNHPFATQVKRWLSPM